MLTEIYDKHRNKINNHLLELDKLKDKIFDCWNSMYDEIESDLRQEFSRKNEAEIKIDERLYKVFNQLSNEKCTKLIKTVIPKRIKLLNKIVASGYEVDNRCKLIIVYFYFNNDHSKEFEYGFCAKDIQRILKLEG